MVGSNPGYQKLEKNISQLFHTRFELQEKINGILLPKLFWPTVRKNCSGDREKLLQNFWDNLNNLFKQCKVRTIFGNRMLFQLVPGG